MTAKTKEVQSDNGQLTANEARRILADEQQRRIEACKRELQAVLDKHGCGLRAMPLITTEGKLAATVEIAILNNGNS